MGRRALLDPVSAKLLLLMLLPLSCGQQNDATTTPIVVDGPRYSSVRCIDELLDCQAVKGIEDILEDFTHYNKMERPTNQGEPTVVNISMTVKNIASIDVTNMDYKMTIFLVRQWRDSRLKLRKEAQLREDHIDMPDEAVSLLWRPSVFFDNEKDSVVHSVTAPNSMLKIYNDSRVLFSMRITLTLSCPMNIEKFPWDIQTCPLTITSASYTANEMLLQWDNKERSIIHKDITNLQFELENIILSDNCTNSEIMGNFSCLHAGFKLRRTISSSDKQMLTSSFLISFLSCFTFLIPIENAGARVSIGVATTISMVTQCASTHANMPKVPYMTSMDCWFNISLLFIIIIFIVSIMQICLCGSKKDNFTQRVGTPATTSTQSRQTQDGQGTSSQSASAATSDSGDDISTSSGVAQPEQREPADTPGSGENNEQVPLIPRQRQSGQGTSSQMASATTLDLREDRPTSPGRASLGQRTSSQSASAATLDSGEDRPTSTGRASPDSNAGKQSPIVKMKKCILILCNEHEMRIGVVCFGISLGFIVALFVVHMRYHKCLDISLI
ncbi:glycine receptor subunit alphaZ1-like [Lethenteron reissneri]|uniref:glycine receptor subunit alphaZ1-like n=1 Tax=Lethenteron reissneri TaxID=7753 RepID=UPI002AB6DD5C|nr:glycine receptor subunit alphaZ1-like [Lethenteron reissneri]